MVFQRVIFGFAVLLLGAHVAATWAASPEKLSPLASNLFQLGASLLALIACLDAARRAAGVIRQFWSFMTATFLLWSAAQLLWTYNEYFGHMGRGQQPTDVLFFFAFGPMLLALLLTPWREARTIDWQRTLDFVQAGIVLLSAFLYFFLIPSWQQSSPEQVEKLIWLRFNLRNGLLFAGFFLRGLLSTPRSLRNVFRRMSAFLLSYAILGGIANGLWLQSGPESGTWIDLAWVAPFVVAVAAAAGWRPEEEPQEEPEATGIRALFTVHLLPTLVPLLVLAMAYRIGREQLFLAFASLLASVLCYSARLAVTHHRQLQTAAQLKDTESRFRLLFASNPHPMWVFAKDTQNFLEVNHAAVSRYGYSREEFLRMKVTDLQREEERGASSRNGNCRHRTKDGRILNVATTAQGLQFAGRNAELVVAEDITEKLHLEDQLRQSQKMEAVGTLAGGVAHDFNNLLTVINGYTRLLQDRLQNDEMVLSQLRHIEKAAERASSLTRQLLAFSRRQMLQPTLINLNETVLGMGQMLRRVIGEHIELVTATSRDLVPIRADSSQIEQVVMNLAINARDAMPQGGRLLFETENVTLDREQLRDHLEARPGEYVLLTVSDTGCGMDETTKAHLFEPFFTTKRGKGTGLGLSTVYGIIKQSGGHITVESEPGKGTTFRIYLPRAHGTAGTGEEARPRTVLKGNETVLLVEDDDELRELSRKILKMNGYEVLAAARDSEAVQICQSFKNDIHLMLTDVIMPGTAGPELAGKLTKLRPTMKVCYMSGYTDNAMSKLEGLGEGTAFLQKPFSPAALARKIREVLDGAPVEKTPS